MIPNTKKKVLNSIYSKGSNSLSDASLETVFKFSIFEQRRLEDSALIRMSCIDEGFLVSGGLGFLTLSNSTSVDDVFFSVTPDRIEAKTEEAGLMGALSFCAGAVHSFAGSKLTRSRAESEVPDCAIGWMIPSDPLLGD